MIKKFNKITPKLPKKNNFFIAENSTLLGKVILEEMVSIWYGAVLRGDNEQILIKRGTNIQDNSVLHTDMGYPLQIGYNCTIGHLCILHGCLIGNNTLIGMGSIIMNGVQIGENCLIGAGSLITEGKKIEDNSLVIGRPAKAVRVLSNDEIDSISQSALSYQNKFIEHISVKETKL